MLSDDAEPPRLPRRRPWRSDPALFDPGVPVRRPRPRLGKTFYSQRPTPPADFAWFSRCPGDPWRRKPTHSAAFRAAARGSRAGPGPGTGREEERAVPLAG